ncbi:glucose dehydrogenase [Trichonephila clavipes]|nr:glucose dehydrogenase [Trichonephila clavipes]
MQDHCSAVVSFELKDKIESIGAKQLETSNIFEYVTSKSGPLASAQGVNAIAFLKQKNHTGPADQPDIQMYFLEASAAPLKSGLNIKPEYYEAIYAPYENKPLYCCVSQILRPKSRGEVTLRSADPHDPPIIDPKYFSDPDDFEVIIDGMKKCNDISNSKPMRKIGAKRISTVYPGCEDDVNDEDKYFRCMARSIIGTANHQVGTAKMGDPSDPTTVVDPELRWFQQDGATCHTARTTIDLLKDAFGDDRLISLFGSVYWTPRSCDLTPLDYFLWGYVKSLVYADKPQTLDHLEDNIRHVIADIRPQMLEKVIENWTSRLDYIRACRGGHMPDIIFKM